MKDEMTVKMIILKLNIAKSFKSKCLTKSNNIKPETDIDTIDFK